MNLTDNRKEYWYEMNPQAYVYVQTPLYIHTLSSDAPPSL